MTILITAFDPFGGEAINPAWEAVNQLDHEIAGAKIIKLQIPTAFMRASQVVAEAMAKVQPDYVLSIGQAGGRSAMTVEFVGINWQDGRIPDNDGFQPTGKPLEEAGDAAYFATLPTAAMVTQMRAAGVPTFMSYSAGTYVCNAVLYRLLYHIQKNNLNCKAGFIHVPYSPDQAVNKPQGTPTMDLATIQTGIQAAVYGILNPVLNKSPDSMGQTE